MLATEVWIVIICMVCVMALVVVFIPESFIIRHDLYEKAPTLFKLCVIIVFSIIIAGVLYISWIRPPEAYYYGF